MRFRDNRLRAILRQKHHLSIPKTTLNIIYPKFHSNPLWDQWSYVKLKLWNRLVYCHIWPLRTDMLTHWGQVTRIYANKITVIGSDNGLSPGQRQAIIWTNAGILLIGTLRTNFSEILIAIRPFSFKKMDLKISSGKWRPFSRPQCVNTNKWPAKYRIVTLRPNCLLCMDVLDKCPTCIWQ